MNNQIQLYTSADGKISLQVSLDNETVWLTQLQMSELFGTTPENVLMHLKNIYKEQEIDEILTTKDFLVVRQEGKRQAIHYYNHERIQVKLKGLNPVEYRTQSLN